MNSLLDDWILFKKKPHLFSESHFYTLFHENQELHSLNIIFDGFLEKEQLIERTQSFIEGKTKSSRVKIEDLIKKDLIEKKNICIKKNDLELLNYLNTNQFTKINKTEFEKIWNTDCPHHWITELIGDYLRPLCEQNRISKAIIESFYGLTMDYNIVWYIAESLFDSDYNPEVYFNIWKNDRDYIIGEKEIFVLS